eukprot:8156609-Alexandrium_andersonii.AAC.1
MCALWQLHASRTCVHICWRAHLQHARSTFSPLPCLKKGRAVATSLAPEGRGCGLADCGACQRAVAHCWLADRCS